MVKMMESTKQICRILQKCMNYDPRRNYFVKGMQIMLGEFLQPGIIASKTGKCEGT